MAWLRQATRRWLNRSAWKIMDALKLSSHTVVEDKEAVRRKVYMLMPTTYTVYYDMCMIMHTNQFLMTNNLTLLHSTSSGEIFDCFAKWVPGYSTGRGRRAHTKNLVPSLGLTRTVTRFRQRPCAITCCMRARHTQNTGHLCELVEDRDEKHNRVYVRCR